MSGTSFDWVKANTNVPVCYLFELRDLGVYGFLLNREQIIDTAVEITNALLAMDKSTRDIGYYEYAPVEDNGSSGKAVSMAAMLISVLVMLLQLIVYKE